ncbi:hypothetical protein [Flavobacterium cerinum]|uniref:Lipoprotein n=1 Tax=Flavobacterium cerinum TaxID=2502784 RepID=A0A444HAY6_9FLAO|nr:hypothetical protein [Flavobacterium cerinum]RWX00497.1 hypothetical protein EPI11_09485 [Flavobacterium cerinum]
MKKCLLFILTGFLFASCKETAKGETDFFFDNPQPINDSELSTIPTKYRGQYNQENQTTLYITDYIIFKESTMAYHKSGIDSIGTLKNGKFTTNDNSETFTAEQKGDSVYLKMFRDTLFSFSPRQKAKHINGQIVLSYKDSISWYIKILSLEKDSLKIKFLMSRNDYTKLKPLVTNIKINSDTTIVNINPTRREFRKILKTKDLGYDMKYKKVK